MDETTIFEDVIRMLYASAEADLLLFSSRKQILPDKEFLDILFSILNSLPKDCCDWSEGRKYSSGL